MIIVEDGSAKSDSESYATVAQAVAFLKARGLTDFVGSTLPTQESALRKATDYLEQVYRQRWKGYKYTSTQALSWPREAADSIDLRGDYFPVNVIPPDVIKACIILAEKSITEDLYSDLEQAEQRVRVGPIEVYYDQSSPQQKRYRSVAALLSPLLQCSSSVQTRLVRS